MTQQEVPEVFELPEERVSELMFENMHRFQELREQYGILDEDLAALVGGFLQLSLAHGSEAQGWDTESVMTDVKLVQASIAETARYEPVREARLAYIFALYHGAKLMVHQLPKERFGLPRTFGDEDEGQGGE